MGAKQKDLLMQVFLFNIYRERSEIIYDYSTVTDLARLRGWSTLQPRITAI